MRAGPLRLSILAAFALAGSAAAQSAPPSPGRTPPELNTLKDVFLAMEVCWQASLPARVVPGMTVRVMATFTRRGEMFGEPKFTFVTPGVPTDTVAAFERAAADALRRCNPLPFSNGLGNALAGRPCFFQFIDQRNQKGT